MADDGFEKKAPPDESDETLVINTDEEDDLLNSIENDNENQKTDNENRPKEKLPSILSQVERAVG